MPMSTTIHWTNLRYFNQPMCFTTMSQRRYLHCYKPNNLCLLMHTKFLWTMLRTSKLLHSNPMSKWWFMCFNNNWLHLSMFISRHWSKLWSYHSTTSSLRLRCLPMPNTDCHCCQSMPSKSMSKQWWMCCRSQCCSMLLPKQLQWLLLSIRP